MPKHTEAYLQILDCVRRAGRLMLKEEEPEIAVKGANDFVTARDREIQDFLIRELSRLFPRAYHQFHEQLSLLRCLCSQGPQSSAGRQLYL